MNNAYQTAFWVFILLTGSAIANSAIAQQDYIPGLTDITSMTAISSPDSAQFVHFLQKGCQDSTYFVGQIRDLKGVVRYRHDLKSYVITYGVPDTIDSQYTYIVCNWPQAVQWLNKLVTFSGRRYQARGVLARYGGESVLYFYVTAVSRD